MITPHTVVSVAPGLTAADLGGEAVVLDAQSGKYYGLNEVGLQIFNLAKQPTTVEHIKEALLREYDVEADRMERDLMKFLHTMAERRLIEVRDGVPA